MTIFVKKYSCRLAPRFVRVPAVQVELALPRSPRALTPYLSGGAGAWSLVCGDVVETLASVPDHSVDLIFADPPYFLSNGGTTIRSGRRVDVGKGAWDESSGLEADAAFHRRWLEQARLVLRPSGTIWVSGTHHVIFTVGQAMLELGFHVLNLVTWYKPNAPFNAGCRQLTHSSELVIWAAPARRDPLPHCFHYKELRAENGGKQLRDVWAIPVTPARERKHGAHPTQKPLELLDRIVRASSRPGEWVLDPFCGSGTTGVAAVRRGRRFLGVDVDAGYLDLTARRLRAEER